MGQKSDYYKILGVSRDATSGEIQKAFRKLAKQYHPDATNNDPNAELKFKAANDAYLTLKDPARRSKYNTEYDQMMRTQTPERSSQTTNRNRTHRQPTGDPFYDFMSEWFKEVNPTSWTQQSPKKEPSFLITENDVALISALMEAYKAQRSGKDEGTWKVKIAETDKRDWMPQYLYRVSLKNGSVHVMRKVTDWRYGTEREEPIKVRKEGQPWEYEDDIAADNYLGEYYTCGRAGERLRSVNIPYEYPRYLNAIKSLARKFAYEMKDSNGNYDVPEVGIISHYAQYDARNTRTERSTPYYNDPRELIREIKYKDFWNEIRLAGNLVETIGTTPERNRPRSPEAREGRSGESKF